MILQQLPALQVVIPMLAAPICFFLHKPKLCWAWAFITALATFAVSLNLLFLVQDGNTISYAMGGWPPPWGIELVVDVFDAFVLVIVSGIGIGVLTYGRASIEFEIPEEKQYLFYTMYLLCMTGLLGMTITGDAFNLFVFLEISALSTYVLIGLGRDRRALTAAYNYLVVGTIGATFYVIGVGMMYMATGSLNMADLAVLMPAVIDSRTVLTGIAFLLIGLALKSAVFPLHMWMPNAYTYAPSTVTCFLSATATKVSIYVLMRMFFTVFGGVEAFSAHFVAQGLMVMAIIAMFVGSIYAIYQTDLKRALAYSSVAQIGYMILGVSFITITGLEAGIIHLFNHAVMKCALFMALGCIFLRISSVKLHDIAGIAKRMPWTMAAFIGAGLSLIGVPGTVGFVSKWYLVQAALEVDAWPIAALVLASSLLAVIYVWRIVEVAYLTKPVPNQPAHDAKEAPLSMLVPMWAMVGACVYFGVDATYTVTVARNAAEFILTGSVTP